MRKFFFLFILCIGLLGAFAFKDVKSEVINTEADLITAEGVVNPAWGKMPLYFVENQGQMDEKVAYYIKGRNKTIYFTKNGLTYVLSKKLKKEKPLLEKKVPILQKEKKVQTGESYRRWVVKLDFVGVREGVTPVGLEKAEAIISYFKGKPEEWKTGLSTYSRIIYKDLWPGIDLVYYGTMDKMKYEFIVHPKADPTQIRLAYSGVSSVEVNSQGRLEVQTPAGGFEDDEPMGYQKINGKRVNVDMTYALEQNEGAKASDQKKYVYGFEVGDYDRSLPLILDPAVMVYCGYIGGSSYDDGKGIAVDSSGNVYVAGATESDETTFPETGGPDLTHNGNMDAFVAKVNSTGTALVYCGYIGGSGDDYGYGIAVDSSGNAYVTGYTPSDETTFPETGGPDLTYNGNTDAFVAKVNSSGTALVYCGYIGGSSGDYGYGIAVDSSGNAYVAGSTSSDETTFPETGGPDLTHNGADDAFVAKVNSTGTALVYCGYIGGLNFDYSQGIAVDSSGNAYVTGYTWSDEITENFPVVGGPDLTHNGSTDAFVAKVNSTGTALVYCGYIGGSSSDDGKGIAVDSSGNAYVTGYTPSDETTFPETGGPDLTHNGNNDAFVAKVNSTGTALVYCGYIGGSYDDIGEGIAVDSSGNAYVTGYTWSDETTFPETGGPDLTHNGNIDAFVAKVNSTGTTLVYCGYIGGSSNDYGEGIAVDSSGNAYVTGHTVSDETTFPETGGPDLTHNGADDAFVTKITHIHTKYRGVIAIDANNNCADELYCDFGSNGLWVYYSTWLKLNKADPDWIMGFQYSGTEYLLCDFGSAGLWYWYYNGSWSGQFVKISSANPDQGFVVDDDADGNDEVYLTFGANGLWRYNMGAATILTKLHATSPVMGDSLRGDLWTVGHDEGALDFEGLGLWTVRDNGGSPVWTKINASSPANDNVSAECGIGDAAEELVIDFGGVGIWLYDGSSWHRLTSNDPDNVVAAYLPGAADNELFCAFSSVSGLWMWDYTGYPGTWTSLSSTNPDSDNGFCEPFDPNDDGWEEVAVDFGSSGLWLYDHAAATKWGQLNTSDAEFMIRCDYYCEGHDTGLVVDFGSIVGLWLYNGKTYTWTKLSSFSPDEE